MSTNHKHWSDNLNTREVAGPTPAPTQPTEDTWKRMHPTPERQVDETQYEDDSYGFGLYTGEIGRLNCDVRFVHSQMVDDVCGLPHGRTASGAMERIHADRLAAQFERAARGPLELWGMPSRQMADSASNQWMRANASAQQMLDNCPPTDPYLLQRIQEARLRLSAPMIVSKDLAAAMTITQPVPTIAQPQQAAAAQQGLAIAQQQQAASQQVFWLESAAEKQRRKLRELRDAQGAAMGANPDVYIRGLYNGLELALAVLEDREPQYLAQPAPKQDEPVSADDAWAAVHAMCKGGGA